MLFSRLANSLPTTWGSFCLFAYLFIFFLWFHLFLEFNHACSYYVRYLRSRLSLNWFPYPSESVWAFFPHTDNAFLWLRTQRALNNNSVLFMMKKGMTCRLQNLNMEPYGMPIHIYLLFDTWKWNFRKWRKDRKMIKDDIKNHID